MSENNESITASHNDSTDVADTKTPARAWAVLVVTYIASAMAPMCQFKVPPLASYLIPTFGLNGVTFGYLMSAMAIIGVILAFPAAFIIRRFGLKQIVLASLVFLFIGSLLSAVAQSAAMVYIGRAFDGIGIGLIGVAAPTCVSIWFPENRRGLALGIWATWVPFGLVLMFNTAPGIAAAWGFRAVSWECAVLIIAAFILFAIVFKMPAGDAGDLGIEGTFRQSFKYLKNKYIWLVGIMFFCFCFCSLGITQTFYNTFLETQLGFSNQAASSITSINTAISFITAPLIGFVFDKVKGRSRKRFVPITMACVCIISFFFMFTGGSAAVSFMIIFIILQGIGAATPATCRPLAPMVMGGTAMGATMGMAVLQFTQNCGTAIGAPLFGGLSAAIGWVPASLALQVPVMVIGIICMFFVNPWKNDGKGEATDNDRAA